MDKTDEWLVSVPIAHRGLFDLQAPENSLAAIQKAAHHGFAVEFDVQLMSDGRFAVFHDPNTNRLTDRSRKVADLTTAGIGSLKILNTSHNVTVLHDVLREVRGRVPLLISVKGWTHGAKIASALESELARYDGRVAVSALSPWVYWHLRRQSIRHPIGLVSSSMASHSLLTRAAGRLYLLMIAYGFLRPDFLSVDSRSI